MIFTGQIGRATFGSWLNTRGLTECGVEVGCAEGAFAKQVLSTWIGSKYYMVDPWAVIDGYLERQETMDYEKWYAECKRMAESDKRITILRMKSLEAVEQFPNESLDWVYLDAAHDLKNIQADMEAWYPKVRVGGVLSGHDFLTNMVGDGRIEVDYAVERFCYSKGLTFTVTPCTSWWLIKT